MEKNDAVRFFGHMRIFVRTRGEAPMSNNWLRFRGTLLRMRGSGGEYPLWFAGLHAHSNKFPISSGWVLDKSGGPFWLSVKRVQKSGERTAIVCSASIVALRTRFAF